MILVSCGSMSYTEIDWSTIISSLPTLFFIGTYLTWVYNLSFALSRKRSREDDSCEFMPLSKRINNLHINNNLAATSASSQNHDSSQANGINGEAGISSPSSSSDSDRRPSYDPGVNSSQSNYFYENKLLFELHLERIQRSGQQFPF